MEIIEGVDDTERTNVWTGTFTIMESIIHCSIIDAVVVNNWSSISVAVSASKEKIENINSLPQLLLLLLNYYRFNQWKPGDAFY